MCLSAVTLCPLTKKAAVMLQCFDHIILRLAYGDIFRDQTSHLVPTQDDLLTLIWFFLAHNGGHHLWRELSICEELPHTNGLIAGRGATDIAANLFTTFANFVAQNLISPLTI